MTPKAVRCRHVLAAGLHAAFTGNANLGSVHYCRTLKKIVAALPFVVTLICTAYGIARSEDAYVFAERATDRRKMVESQLHGLGRTTITDHAVLKSMRHVPRHLFIPKRYRSLAYSDSAVPIGYGQTISQPYIVALMTQELDLDPGMKVLESVPVPGTRPRFSRRLPMRSTRWRSSGLCTSRLPGVWRVWVTLMSGRGSRTDITDGPNRPPLIALL